MNRTIAVIVVLFCVFLVSGCENNSASPSNNRIFPVPVIGLPPEITEIGPRVTLTSENGGMLPEGSYSRKSFTTGVSLSNTGAYIFSDCEFKQGFTTVFGGSSVTRTVRIEYCRLLSGLYFEDGGQKGWTIIWSDLRGTTQAIRPKGVTIYDNLTPTTFVVRDSIVAISSLGSPSVHCEAMQSLGGNFMSFIRVRFITQGPYVDGVTGQTASINHGGGDTLFDACEFLSADAFNYTVYSDGNNVLFRNCRFARGLAGYIYPESTTTAAFVGCTDIVSGESI